MEKKRMSSLAAITLRISIVIFAIWLLCMSALTYTTTQYVRSDVYEAANDYVYFEDTYSLQKVVGMADRLEDHAVERQMLTELRFGAQYHPRTFGSWPDWLGGSLNSNAIEYARAFYSADDELLMCSGDYFHFYYSLTHNWGSEGEGWAYVNVDRLRENPDAAVEKDWYEKWVVQRSGLYDHLGFRMTGHFDGSEFVASKLEYDANRNNGTSKKGREWVTCYDDNSADENSVTIYANYPDNVFYKPGDPVKYRGEIYENIRELLLIAPAEKLDDSMYAGPHSERIADFDKVLIFGSETIYEWDEDGNIDTYRPAIKMVSAAVAYPLKMAVSSLVYIYSLTFVLCVAIVLLLRRSVKKNFTDPVKLVYKGVSDGWGYVATSLDSKTMWREPYEISRHYRETLDKLRADKNEIARLTTALEYAEEAEEQRRQMSSNIAHELKTPLAVIRSYAEGLQEHIAEEKRDKYLEVIVGETERMDELVLEMLELSRLEAGRVKLARDVCDLSALAHSVFEKLEPAAEAKELTITYQLQKDCIFSADEARILQVISNFASNALRYTPVGGHIWVRTSMARGYVSLAVENTSPPLSDEVLDKVWERFWRAEESRSEKSSGLGLAIAKSIVELHGGKCTARNTENGVEFAFTI